MNMKTGISLGNVCNSAVWATLNNYRDTKQTGYKTCVFDLMISNYSGVVKCILEDFNNFTNPDFLVMDYIIGVIKNTYYDFAFNHEAPYHANLYIDEKWEEGPNHFINNNYSHFIERYNRRINNFKDYLGDTENVISFIIEFKYEANPNNNCEALRNALAIKYPNLNYEIIDS